MKCVALAEGPREIARRHLADAGNGWSIGTWGAIGEFQYDADEPGLVLDLASLSITSPRGALHIGDLSDAMLFALIDDAGRTREIAFCSPRPAARRTTIHELDETTFDLGIGAPHVDMMVRLRADDAATRVALREGVGRPLLAPGNPAGPAIGRSSPTRVFASALARLEVHQPIPPPGGRSPEGPHSHLLPHYLKEGRAHAPGSPLPAGLYCGLSLYPRTTAQETTMDDKTRTELEAAAFRRLVAHLQERTDVQNIDLMNLAGFCRNCLSRWYREEAGTRGIEIADPKAREIVYGMPYDEWKAKHQKEASGDQKKAYDKGQHKHG